MILNQQFGVLLTRICVRLFLRGGHPFTTEPLGKFQRSARHSCFPYTFLSFLHGHHFLRTPGQSRSILTNSLQHSLISEVKNIDVDLKKKHGFAHSDSTVVIQRGTSWWLCPTSPTRPFSFHLEPCSGVAMCPWFLLWAALITTKAWTNYKLSHSLSLPLTT